MNDQLTKGGRTMPVSTMLRSSGLRRALAVAATMALAAGGLWLVPSAQASAPAGVRVAAGVPTLAHVPGSALTPDTGCTTADTTATCDLWAEEGSLSVAAGTPAVTVWTFVGAEGEAISKAVGPTLVVTEGQTVNLVLHNRIPGEAVSLSLPQVDGFPDDLTGAASGDDKPYEFTAVRPGTFLYQAGGTTDGPRQAGMGLVGALVVLPSTGGGAYGTPNTAYTDEGVLIISDVDPGLNAAPGSYDMRNFAPRYRLFNGLASPSTQNIEVTPGTTALLRVLNAAIVQHSVGVLGTTQTVIAEAARPLSHPYGVAAETIPAGDTMDFLVSVPAGAGLKYAVYDSSMVLNNNGATSSLATGNIVTIGGGLTFLDTGGGGPVSNNSPVVTAASVTPARSGSATAVSFSATVTDDVSVQSVEYVIDNAGVAGGSGTAVATTPAAGASVSVTSAPLDISSLATGTHQLLVRGYDGTSWGALQAAAFKVDKTGPTVSSITPAATAVNGSADLAFTGSVTDVGGGTVASSTWSLDGGAPTVGAQTPATGATVAVAGSVPAATLAGLADGLHYLSITSTDDLGNVGDAGPAGTPVGGAFLVDTTDPTTGPVVVTPSPNNGTQGVSYDPTAVEVRAPASDPGASASGVVSGEGFIGSPPASEQVRGFTMVTNTSGGPLSLVGTIPLSQLNSLPNGATTIYVRALDKAGNWSAVSQGDLVMNRQVVTVGGLTLTPGTTSTAATVALAGTATVSAGLSVGAAEYFVDADPGAGAGTAMTVRPPNQAAPISATIPVAGLTVGDHSIGVRARDTNGVWGPVTTVTLHLTSLFKDGFEGASLPGPWAGVSTSGAGSATQTAGAAMSGSQGLRVSVNGTGNRAYVTTPTTTAVATYHVKFQLDPSTLQTGSRWVPIYQARGGNTERFRVELRRNGTGGTPQVRLVVSTGNGGGTTAAVNLSAGTNDIQVDWTSAASATVTLSVNGTPTALTGRNTNNRTVTNSRLGIYTGPSGGNGTYGGVAYFDAFNSAYYGF